ncbi:hypothetical protein PGS1_22441 [Enterobacter cloacae subsp. cloacae GS1]|nr:hypothetical protein PGS1_22441 [Enterobacter cloacae subsp. cloacae GS1]
MIKHYSLIIDTMELYQPFNIDINNIHCSFVFYPKSADESTAKPDSNINFTIRSSFDLKYDDCIKRLPALKEDFEGYATSFNKEMDGFYAKNNSDLYYVRCNKLLNKLEYKQGK